MLTYIIFFVGIVRGIDINDEILFLITPEPIEILEKAFYLVLGSVSLPPSAYMAPDDVTGSVPFVMRGELAMLGQLTKRSYLPPNKK